MFSLPWPANSSEWMDLVERSSCQVQGRPQSPNSLSKARRACPSMGLDGSLGNSLCQMSLETSHLTGKLSWKEIFPLNIFISTILQYCSYNGPVDPMYVKDPRSTNTVALSKTPRMSPIRHSSGGRWLRTHLGKRSDWESMWTLKLLPYHVISYPFYFVVQKKIHFT